MTNFTTDTLAWPLLTELSSCLCRSIDQHGLPEPCFCGVLSGDSVTMDYCGECIDSRCGMAWTRLVGIAGRSRTAITGVIMPRAARSCHIPLEVTIEVGILRCAPMPHDDGTLPDMVEQLEAARLQAADMNAALWAITCCLKADFEVDTWTPIGPIGDCLGGAWTVLIEVD